MNWLAHHKFQALLLSLILLLVVYPPLHELVVGQIVLDILVSLLFLAALQVIFTQRYLRLLGLILGIPTLLGNFTGYVLPHLPELPLVPTFHLCAALFLGLTLATILRAIFRDDPVPADSIYGAFGGYLLVGVAFGHLYCFLESTTPGSFRGSPDLMAQMENEKHRRFLLTYFSLVTLTTLGYGEITPASSPARGLAVTEAILGQFYLAVLIAELIGKRVSQAVTHQEAEAKDRNSSPNSHS
jgi:hypothetical protein